MQAMPNAARPDRGLLGTAAVIVAESMFFLGVFFAWFYLRAQSPGFVPPVAALPPLVLPIVNTVIAAVSTATMAFVVRSIAAGHRERLVYGLIATIVLGMAFMGIQSVEFARLGFTASSGTYASMFIAVLVFHVARVFVGVVLMIICLARALAGHFSPARHTAVKGTAMYWYFITGVWFVVFYVLFLV